MAVKSEGLSEPRICLLNLRLLLCVPVLASAGSGTSPSLRDGDGWYRLWHAVSA